MSRLFYSRLLCVSHAIFLSFKEIKKKNSSHYKSNKSSGLPPQFWRLINSTEMVSGKQPPKFLYQYSCMPVLQLQQQYHFLVIQVCPPKKILPSSSLSMIQGHSLRGNCQWNFLVYYQHFISNLPKSYSSIRSFHPVAPVYTLYTYFFPKKAVLHADFSDHTIFFWYP